MASAQGFEQLVTREALMGFNDDSGTIVNAGDPAQVHPVNLALYVSKGYIKAKSDKDSEAVADVSPVSGVTTATTEGTPPPERKAAHKG